MSCRYFNLNESKDVEEVINLLVADDDDPTMEDEFGEESDVASDDEVEERGENSETEQDDETDLDDENSGDILETGLMFNRVIRDKIPGIQDITEDKLDSAARDLDIINKAKGKEAADKKRRAKICDIAPGDKVVLRNVVFPHKLTPTFDTLEYEIIEKKGNEVIIAGGGKTFRRNISHVKKVPPPLLDRETISLSMPTPTTPNSTNTPTYAHTNATPSSLSNRQTDPVLTRTPESGPNISSNETPGQPKLRLKLQKKEGMWRAEPQST